MADLIAQLKAHDPARRRAAVVELVKAGDSSVVDILRRVAATDPDGVVRDLAEKGAAQLQIEQWRRAQQEIHRVALPEEIEPSAQELRLREQRRIGNAKSNLQMAVHHYTANERDEALLALSNALITDPALASDRDARWLACSLFGMTDTDQAMQALQAHIAAEQKINQAPVIDSDRVRFAGLAIGLIVVLLLTLAVFYRIYDHDLVSIVGWTTFGTRLSAFFRALNPSSVARAFVPALLLLIALMGGNIAMYLLSTIWLGCTASIARFVSAVSIAQLLIIALGLLCLIFMPVTTVVAVPGPNGTSINTVAVSSYVVAFGLFWVLLLQSFAVARLSGVPIPKGAVAVFAGFIAFYVLARTLIGLTLAGA